METTTTPMIIMPKKSKSPPSSKNTYVYNQIFFDIYTCMQDSKKVIFFAEEVQQQVLQKRMKLEAEIQKKQMDDINENATKAEIKAESELFGFY